MNEHGCRAGSFGDASGVGGTGSLRIFPSTAGSNITLTLTGAAPTAGAVILDLYYYVI